ncbi:hypothetical protein HG537_0D02870 [Torulaspora globosa]|uniref:RNA exonuclease 4 n=1 Tax=Torulaspora globosa TaxID=48254 RepID=A0A7H9HT43_9SACH|nr:hypothetical protein HG537_0D02870 [Torulaspora sp. CBS 2947]
MVLSSNWLKLQVSEELSSKDEHKSRNLKKNEVTKPIRKEVKQRQSRIMSMVYSMSREIEKSERDKREGKEFKFKETSVVKSDAQEIEELFGKVSFEKASAIGKYLAMDCEFVGVGPEGKESALARVSLVNYYGHVILDEFVKPREKVTDWRTWVSGVKPEHMKDALTFREVQKKVASLLENRILVGHSIKHDLEALLISHPKSSIRDTSRHLPFRQAYAKGKTPSLKKLAKEILKRDIQVGEHSPIEDARITMLVYRSDRKEFERLHRARYK